MALWRFSGFVPTPKKITILGTLQAVPGDDADAPESEEAPNGND